MGTKPTIRFRLDPRRGVAPYRQLVEQVEMEISMGQLKPGDRLPPVREVITQITINPNTVYRAYRELEHLGLAEVQWGVGTFIKAPYQECGNSNCPSAKAESLSIWVRNARLSGSNDKEIMNMVLSQLRNSARVDS
jgi:GntR family transcriptional regulator